MVLQHDVAVVVDSSSCLPEDLLRKWNITVVPHELIIDQRSLRDGVDIQPTEFYRLLSENDSAKITTAAPQPRQFLDAFIAASQTASNVLCLTLSPQFSATYRSACAAATMSNGASPAKSVGGPASATPAGAKIKVVDSKAAAGGSGLIALAAARWAHEGRSLDEVVEKVDGLTPKVNLLAYLDTLRYLSRSGRVHKIAAWAGTMLSIKPLTELKLGEARMLERPRSRAKAKERMLAVMRQRVADLPVVVNVMEADAIEEARDLSQRIQSEFNCRELIVSQFTPVMGLHTGPGLLGVAFYTVEPDQPDDPQIAPEDGG